MQEKKVLAIDPGRDKCGIAILNSNCEVVYNNIVSTVEFELYLAELLNKNKIQNIILGNGTYSDEIKEKISADFKIPVILIDESYSTEKAEERYYQEHYNKGWRKLLSFIKWKPAQPLDDYVAIILAEKYIKEIKNK